VENVIFIRKEKSKSTNTEVESRLTASSEQ